MRIAITGHEGYLGSLVFRLLSDYHPKGYDILNDITKKPNQLDICHNTDVIINLAALSGIKACDDNEVLAMETNCTANIDLCKMAKKFKVKRFIFSSTSAVYGEVEQPLMDELHPTNPRNIYGKTKLWAESILKYADNKFEVIILRQSNLYGMGIKCKGITVIDKFIESAINGTAIKISGDGSQLRDFAHVMDVANLHKKLALAKKVRSGIYNVGGGEILSIKTLANLVNENSKAILGHEVPILFVHSDNGSLFHNFTYDYSKAKMEFQYAPFFSIDYYIKERMLAHLRT